MKIEQPEEPKESQVTRWACGVLVEVKIDRKLSFFFEKGIITSSR